MGRWPESLECFRDGNDKLGKLPRFSVFVMADGLDAKSCVMSEGIGRVEWASEFFYAEKNWLPLGGEDSCAKKGEGGGGACQAQ